MLRSAISAFTRVFDALCLAAWCAADPGSIGFGSTWVPALRCIMKNVAPRPGNESLSLPPLHRTRGGAVTPDQVRHIETGNCAIGDHPFSPNHHPVGAMRPAQNQRRHRVAVAGEAQFVELEQREIGGFSNSDLAKFGAADAGR
jgi:hypothetical protein